MGSLGLNTVWAGTFWGFLNVLLCTYGGLDWSWIGYMDTLLLKYNFDHFCLCSFLSIVLSGPITTLKFPAEKKIGVESDHFAFPE